MANLAENARRKAQGKKPAVISPLALEAVRRIDEPFEIERAINGQSPERGKAVREKLSAPLVANPEAWVREQRAKLSRGNDVAKAMDYMLKGWTAFTHLLDDGRICLSNNAAERGVRGIALGRKSWLFCGSDRGGDERAAVMYSLIVTAKMNDIDPQAWLARRCPGSHRRASRPKIGRAPTLELAPAQRQKPSGSLTFISCEQSSRGSHRMLTYCREPTESKSSEPWLSTSLTNYRRLPSKLGGLD
jgi:Transposase IS66 family